MQITPIEFNKTKSSQKKKGKSGKEGGRGGGVGGIGRQKKEERFSRNIQHVWTSLFRKEKYLAGR